MKRFIKWISSLTLPEFYVGQEWKLKSNFNPVFYDEILRTTDVYKNTIWAVNIYGQEKVWRKKLIRKRYNKIR